MAEQNDATFAGTHVIRSDNPCGVFFDIFFGPFESGTGWYWWRAEPGGVGPMHGPFPTAEGAYLDAIGE